MTEDLARRLEAYRRGVAVAKEMLSRGIIDEKEFERVRTKLTKVRGLTLDTIFR